jgi:hypothetical protein
MAKNAKSDRKRPEVMTPATYLQVFKFAETAESWDVRVLKKLPDFYESYGSLRSTRVVYALGRARWGASQPQRCLNCGGDLKSYESGWKCKVRRCEKTTSYVYETRFHRMELDEGQIGLICFLVGAWPISASVGRVPAVVFERVLRVSPVRAKKIRRLIYEGANAISRDFLRQLSADRMKGDPFRPIGLIERVAKQLLRPLS